MLCNDTLRPQHPAPTSRVPIMRDIQISFATDAGYLRPTLVAMASAIEKASRPVTVHLLGDGLPEEVVEIAETVCAKMPGAALVHHDVTQRLPERFESEHWSRGTLARLCIPTLIEGRVLHLDGDTMTFADIAPLFDLDLHDDIVAGVRDFAPLHWISKNSPMGRSRLPVVTELMSPYPIHDYFNAGVLLMDTDRIRSDSGILQKATDMELAKKLEYHDQDLLNMAFKGRARHLDPSWNSFYGRTGHIGRVARAALPPELVHGPSPLGIVHFVYDPKPFKAIKREHWRKTSVLFRLLPMLVRYRLNARRLLRPVEDALKRIES